MKMEQRVCGAFQSNFRAYMPNFKSTKMYSVIQKADLGVPKSLGHSKWAFHFFFFLGLLNIYAVPCHKLFLKVSSVLRAASYAAWENRFKKPHAFQSHWEHGTICVAYWIRTMFY